MAEAEEVQELGRQGVAEVKRWLEATTFLELQWNAYENGPMCTLMHRAGRKKFDLVGNFISEARQPIYVEAKKYSKDGGQHKEYRKFLAIAYSATARSIEERGGDIGAEFIWITFNPFYITGWKELATGAKIESALMEFPELLGDKEIDFDLVRKVADRVWLLVLNEKQGQITMSFDELMKVFTVLDRKKTTL
ncbi:hypothetical protein [Nocardia cyriacigeorgica]|uniref:hypothetical protein n=1 Tax=Nocardia cyriacigeorgica TaxID=135487 RepID=UPI0024574FD3|nr:hypothetical protein [Nocardia cyriacigeorgica]